MWWTIVLDKLLGWGTDYFKNEIKLKEEKVLAKVRYVQKQQDADNQIDMITLMDRGWKDDLITYTLLSIVIITVFNPLASILFGYDPSIITLNLAEGFENLENLPEEIWWGMLIVLADVFGLRTFLRDILQVFVQRVKKKHGLE